jgi:hypothetical protein
MYEACTTAYAGIATVSDLLPIGSIESRSCVIMSGIITVGKFCLRSRVEQSHGQRAYCDVASV